MYNHLKVLDDIYLINLTGLFIDVLLEALEYSIRSEYMLLKQLDLIYVLYLQTRPCTIRVNGIKQIL